MSHQFEECGRANGITEWRHRGNGLTVLTCPTPVSPVVSFGVVYRVGSRHEVAGCTGATHILEHLMFKGSRRFNPELGTEIARELQRVGAAFNATTWLDRTNYYETLPVEHLDLAVAIESDRMRHALVRDADLESERTVVLNELDAGENDPFDLLVKQSLAHTFLEHPYHHPTIGWRSDVEGITGEVLRRFYDTYYHPDNASVLVAGDVTPERALDAVERGFGATPPAPAPIPGVRTRESEQRGERRFKIHRAGELGCLALTWRIPRGLDPDLPPLSVLTQVLSDGVTSRLHQRLVETNRCLAVHAFAFELHDPGVFQVFATLAPGVDHDEVEAAIRHEVASLRQAPPSSDEVARAKIQTRTDLAFHHSSPAQIVAGLTEAVAMGDWRRFTSELDLVSAVEDEDLVRVAAEHLTDRRLTAGWFVPEGGGGSVSAPEPRPRPCFLQRPFEERVAVEELPGGARLAVLANPHAPTVTVAGTLLAGTACASDGRFTVPGITAAMLERGTARRSRMELARDLEDHGLQLGIHASGASPTVVSFSGQGLTEELERLATAMVEMLRRPSFPPDELDRLREQVLASLVREREETYPQAFAALTRELYPAGYPIHRRPVEERREELESLTPDDLAAFHREVYGPASLVLAVVGRVDPAEVRQLLARLLEGWTGGLDGPPAWPAPPAHGPARRLVQIDERPNLDVLLGHAGRLRRDDDDYPAAIVANSVLGQSTLTSRLGRAVRDREGLSYGIYSRFFGTLHLPGPWATFFSVSPENFERAVELATSIIASYAADGPTADEIDEERQAQSGAYRVGLATNAGIARELVSVLTLGEPVSRLDDHPERLLGVTRDDVMAAIPRHLDPERLVLAAAGSVAGIGP